MTTELLKDFEKQITALELVPSSGGVFEVSVDDNLIFSKKAAGRHAATGEIIQMVRELVGPVEPDET